MQPFYGGYQPRLQLHPDDIAGIQSLYGVREGRSQQASHHHNNKHQKPPSTESPHLPAPPPRAPPAPPVRTTTTTTTERSRETNRDMLRPDLCKDARIDAITATKDGTIYAFKGVITSLCLHKKILT